MSEEFNFMIKNKPDNTFGIATAFYNTYQDRFVCINTTKQLGDWYHFKNNRCLRVVHYYLSYQKILQINILKHQMK